MGKRECERKAVRVAFFSFFFSFIGMGDCSTFEAKSIIGRTFTITKDHLDHLCAKSILSNHGMFIRSFSEKLDQINRSVMERR